MNSNKLSSFLKSGNLFNLFRGQSLDSLLSEMGLPDDYKSSESLMRDVDRVRTETRNRDLIVWYASIEVYVHAVEKQVMAYVINYEYYKYESLPTLLIEDGWKDIFDHLFGCSESDLRSLLKNLSIEGRKIIYHNSYLTVQISDSDVGLFFCGDNGVDGLCKIGVDYRSHQTELW